jgi:hypothetical protein
MVQIGVGAGVSAAVGTVAAFLRAQSPRPADFAAMLPQLKPIQEVFHRRACELVDANQLARPNGYIYTVDPAQLMIYFAQARDERRYDAMRDYAAKNLIMSESEGNFTRGFVIWKWKPGDTRDASGTTEAIRLARGLWLGAKAFNRPPDADLALKVLDGYARHGYTDQGIWFIRNYYKPAMNAFATNSFLVDYDPDFVREVAEERKDKELQKLADNSYGAIKSAVAPSGLLYDMIQPEVATLYPEMNLTTFSPNDVVQFSNCCTTAMSVVRGDAETARRILAFGLNRLDDLRVYYRGASGEPYDNKSAAVTEYSMLARLAVRLGSEQAVATVADRAMNVWRWCASHMETIQLFTLTEMLLAFQEIGAMKS